MSQILVVDDDPALHELIEGTLTGEGHSLRHAFGGREGLEMLRQDKFDLALIDYLMPEMDGGERIKILALRGKIDGALRELECIVQADAPGGKPICQRIIGVRCLTSRIQFDGCA